jgi:hypothetical protein
MATTPARAVTKWLRAKSLWARKKPEGSTIPAEFQKGVGKQFPAPFLVPKRGWVAQNPDIDAPESACTIAPPGGDLARRAFATQSPQGT